MLTPRFLRAGMPWPALLIWNDLVVASWNTSTDEARIPLSKIQAVAAEKGNICFPNLWRAADLYFPQWDVQLDVQLDTPHILFSPSGIQRLDVTEPLAYASRLLDVILSTAGVDAGHGIEHATCVLAHAHNALLCEPPRLSLHYRRCILFGALLHDADDDKFFPNKHEEYQLGPGDIRPHPNKNAVNIIRKCNDRFPELQLDTSLIIEMIELVGTAKNGNSKVAPGSEWKLIVRWCDRLEAGGQIGIDRTISFATHKGMPMSTPNTPSVHNDEDLERVAPYTRFLAYGPETRSPSVIDHFYDKILHIGLRLEDTQNAYLLEQSTQSNAVVKSFIFDYWRQHSD